MGKSYKRLMRRKAKQQAVANPSVEVENSVVKEMVEEQVIEKTPEVIPAPEEVSAPEEMSVPEPQPEIEQPLEEPKEEEEKPVQKKTTKRRSSSRRKKNSSSK